VPHRHNPEDLVPVIKVQPDYEPPEAPPADYEEPEEHNWAGLSLRELEHLDDNIADMVRRVIVSVEQFTSFRGFTWCPLGSLHKRLRLYDHNMAFQQSVEYLIANEAAEVNEYPNPQSDFFTKGITLKLDSDICRTVLNERDTFIRLLLTLYERNQLITEQSVRTVDPDTHWDLELWFSVMETENVLNPVPGRTGQYSLFRTHHTVSLVADAQRNRP
jgi:hypothetical protein